MANQVFNLILLINCISLATFDEADEVDIFNDTETELVEWKPDTCVSCTTIGPHGVDTERPAREKVRSKKYPHLLALLRLHLKRHFRKSEKPKYPTLDKLANEPIKKRIQSIQPSYPKMKKSLVLRQGPNHIGSGDKAETNCLNRSNNINGINKKNYKTKPLNNIVSDGQVKLESMKSDKLKAFYKLHENKQQIGFKEEVKNHGNIAMKETKLLKMTGFNDENFSKNIKTQSNTVLTPYLLRQMYKIEGDTTTKKYNTSSVTIHKSSRPSKNENIINNNKNNRKLVQDNEGIKTGPKTKETKYKIVPKNHPSGLLGELVLASRRLAIPNVLLRLMNFEVDS